MVANQNPSQNNQSQQPEQTPKQMLVERVKSANNILVTVGKNPSVDQLASALGLSLMLTKMDKHSTAVASGQIPSAMKFLNPETVLRENVDNLRDFIIALDKSKADKLRYKVENDIVRIYITPFNNALSQEDLTFTQGEINVELVIALGVGSKGDLDEAIAAHGKILHDATIITVNSGNKQGTLGSINWSEPAASSISEMLVSVSEAFQGGLLDQQISNALLTGIIAATDKFSGDNTTPKVMTMAAQLMAAGADQHLIIDNLDKGSQDSLRQQFAEDKAKPKAKNNKQKKPKQKPKAKKSDKLPTQAVPGQLPAQDPIAPQAPKPPVSQQPADTNAMNEAPSIDELIAQAESSASDVPAPKPALPPISPANNVEQPVLPAELSKFSVQTGASTTPELNDTSMPSAPVNSTQNSQSAVAPTIVPEISPGRKKDGDDLGLTLSDSIRPTPNIPQVQHDSLSIDPITGKPISAPEYVPPVSIDAPELNNPQPKQPVFSGTASEGAKKFDTPGDNLNHIAAPVTPSPQTAVPVPPTVNANVVSNPSVSSGGLDSARSSVEDALQSAQAGVGEVPPQPQL